MGYRRALTLRWSRRDRLAVLVIAVTVAFLTGVTLMGFAMGAQTTTLAEGFGSADTVEQFDSVASARANAPTDAYVLPTTTVTVDGAERTVIGIPESVPEITVRDRSYVLPSGADGVLAAATQPRTVDGAVETATGTRDVRLTTRSSGQIVSDRWFVTTPATVERLGPSGAFVYAPTGADSGGTSGEAVPLLSALAFFVLATRQLVDLLLLASLAGGVLVAVTAFSVTRVAVEDRRSTISVVRSTGATPRSVYALFGARALLLSVVGVGLGYALGLVLVRSVVNAAVFAGAPTSLTVSVSAEAARLLVPTSLMLVAVGGVAGVVAAIPAVRPPPAQVVRADDRPDGDGLLTRLGSDGLREWLRPTLLDWSALVPSTATLTVFVLFVLLIAAAGGVLAPLTAADEQTITQAEAVHPLNSNVPSSYAETLQQQGIAASPEILLFGARDDEPFVARGVDYDAYASLSSTTIVRGRPPADVDEAVVGADLGRTLDVGVGETMTVGGSTQPAFTRVEIVGVYRGDGIEDDQLLLSLETARQLTTKSDGTVHLVRTEPLPTGEGTGPTLSVLDAAVDTNDTRTRVRLTVQNYGLSPVDEPLEVTLGDQTRTASVALDSGRQTRLTVTFPPRSPGTYQLRAGDFEQSVEVGTSGESGALTVTVPAEIPTGGSPTVAVTRGSRPVSGATVTVVGTEQNATTNDAGRARLSFPTAGQYTVETTAGETATRTEVAVADRFVRGYTADVAVSPTNPSIATRPVAVATLKNPWGEPVTRTVTLAQGDRVAERRLTLDPGETERLRLRLPFQPAGDYTVSVSQEGGVTAETTYTVQGDERLAAALASSGRQSSGGGIAQAVSIVFGNIQVLLGALVVLVGTMTVGATTASFARSIHAARDEVGVRRAVGAAPTTIYRLVVGDVLRIGGVATLVSTVLASGLVWALLGLGELRLFGVALRPSFSPTLLVGAAACALALAVVSACVATVSLVSVSPATLLAPVTRRVRPARRQRETEASGEGPADD